MNTSQEQLIAQALGGRHSFVYRGWMIYVYPLTLERPEGRRAAAEATPTDKGKIPAGKSPGARLACGVIDTARQLPFQIRAGLQSLFATIDAIEAGQRG